MTPQTTLPELRVAPPQRKGVSVHRVVERANEILRERTVPLWVRGEVSGWKRMSSGHCYFTLKDSYAELRCVLWARDAARQPVLPRDGAEILALGQLSIYSRKGEFQLQVSDLEGTGAGGLWHLEREAIRTKLRAEGLLDEARKRPLPVYPERVGVVTSAASAAFQDMRRVLRRKAWWIPVLVSDCGVEGRDAAPGIAAAIRRFSRAPGECEVDVVIVARGGGSPESLWAYNTEEVARAIAECPVPVISAVGHETDYTVADEVADLRAATPTAGAERAVPDGALLLGWLDEQRPAMRRRVTRTLALHEDALSRQRRELDRGAGRRVGAIRTLLGEAERHLEARAPRQSLRRMADDLTRLEAALHMLARRQVERLARDVAEQEQAVARAANARLASATHTLAALAEALDARSPLRVLARGYAVLDDPATGRIVRAATDTAPGRMLRVRLASGELAVRVEATHPSPSDPEPADS